MMHLSDVEFWASSYKKIKFLVEKLGEEYGVDDKQETKETKEITSMKEIIGWC